MELKKNATGKEAFRLKGAGYERFEIRAAMDLEPLPQRELLTLCTLMNKVLRISNNSNFLQSDDPEFQLLKWNLLNNLRVSGMELNVLYHLSSRLRTRNQKSSHLIGE